MYNERIITHFQSYTTAKGCVKDLTNDFSGRISVVAIKREAKPVSAPVNGEIVGDEIIGDLSEIGGIALGMIADLIPGMGPILSGGPVVGAIVGDVFGRYMVARGHLDEDSEAHMRHALPVGTVYVAVAVASEEEAEEVERIMREHGGEPERSSEMEDVTLANAELHEVPDTTDLIPPFSPRAWIDANVGLGDLELADPRIFTPEAQKDLRDGPTDHL